MQQNHMKTYVSVINAYKIMNISD